ncbi:MAG: monovalent cation/H(+) antiporter subunit G [SAR202 cluster bacterium]|nr:monovalent cation/H(+) antiporter subunit G [SAR202 cluster bacterium]
MSVAGVAIVSVGLMFMVVTSIGLLRLPDFFTRAHAVSKTETMGIMCVMLGLAVYEGFSAVSVKLLVAWVFVVLGNPLAIHLLMRAAIRSGLRPWTRGMASVPTRPEKGKVGDGIS